MPRTRTSQRRPPPVPATDSKARLRDYLPPSTVAEPAPKLRDYLPEDTVMEPTKRLTEYLKVTPKAPPVVRRTVESVSAPPPEPAFHPARNVEEDDFEAIVTQSAQHAGADLDDETPLENDSLPLEEPVVPPSTDSGPDSVAKINLLHGIFDRFERTLTDLGLEGSNGRASETVRERMGRLLHKMSKVVGDTLANNFGGDFPVVYKSPSSIKRLVMDWSAWIGDEAQVVKSEWIVAEGLSSSKALYSPKTTSVYLSGGTLDATYLLTNRITDSIGRVEERSVVMRVTKT